MLKNGEDSAEDHYPGQYGNRVIPDTGKKSIAHSPMLLFHICCIGKKKPPTCTCIPCILRQCIQPYPRCTQLVPLRPEQVSQSFTCPREGNGPYNTQDNNYKQGRYEYFVHFLY